MIVVDVALLIYLATLLINAGNIACMIWWAVVYPKASMIFKCLAVLFVSVEYSIGLSAWSRWMGPEWYTDHRHTWYWELKNLPTLLTFTIIFSIFVYRLKTTINHFNNKRSDK